MNSIRIARELVRMANDLLQKERSYHFSGKGTANASLIITLPTEFWHGLENNPYWIEILDFLNDDCKGNFHGIDHSCFKVRNDGHEVGNLSFNDINDADHKSPRKKIENDLDALGFTPTR